jgi:arsenate reductase
MKILIICTGNSCRSQMAEGILKSLNPDLEVFSAGTNPADSVNSLAVQVCNEIGIDISHNIAKNVNIFLKDSFDFVITVCDNAKNKCPEFTGDIKNHLHIRFDDPYDAVGSVDEKLDVYRKVRDEIRIEFSKFNKYYYFN